MRLKDTTTNEKLLKYYILITAEMLDKRASYPVD